MWTQRFGCLNMHRDVTPLSPTYFERPISGWFAWVFGYLHFVVFLLNLSAKGKSGLYLAHGQWEYSSFVFIERMEPEG